MRNKSEIQIILTFSAVQNAFFFFLFFYPTTEKIYVYIYTRSILHTTHPDTHVWQVVQILKTVIQRLRSRVWNHSEIFVCVRAYWWNFHACVCLLLCLLVSLFCAGLSFFIIHVFKISASVSEVSIAQLHVDKHA